MSTYYDYFLAYKKDGQFYEHKFVNNQELLYLDSRSNSFNNDLDDLFNEVSKEEISDELFNSFKNKLYPEYQEKFTREDLQLKQIKLVDLEKLNKNSGIRRGFIKKETIEVCEKIESGIYDGEMDYDNLDYELISPLTYLNLDEKEQKKYGYYAYYNPCCRDALVSNIIRTAYNLLEANTINYNEDELYIMCHIN